MIFHTAADSRYFEYFFKNWHETISLRHPNASFSLRFVGKNYDGVIKYCKSNRISITVDESSLEEIKNRYNIDNDEDAKGYYAMSRWISLPADDDVCVTDIDLLMVKQLSDDIIKSLNEHNFVSVCRQKYDHPNVMMCMIIRKDKVKEIRDFAIRLLDESRLRWDLDTAIATYIEQEYEIAKFFNLFKMDHSVQKNIPVLRKDVIFGYCSAISIMGNNKIMQGAEAKRFKNDILRNLI